MIDGQAKGGRSRGVEVGGRWRLISVVTGLVVVVVVSAMVVMQWDRIVEWYQVRRMVGTWEYPQVDPLRAMFPNLILSPEITVTHDRHMVIKSPFMSGPRSWEARRPPSTWAAPGSNEDITTYSSATPTSWTWRTR